MPPEYTQWVQQQQAQALAQQAALRGQTVEALLASQRWEQLSAQLPR
jgi:hypothetical protein